MLLPTHLAGSYCAVEALLRVRGGRGASLRGPLRYGVGAGAIPDLDLLPLALRLDWSLLGDQVGSHRESLLHTPVFALVLALVPMLLPVSRRGTWALAGVVGAATHLILDSLTIGWGVMWLFPFSHTFYGINIVTRWYGAEWGDRWLISYLSHPSFLVELAIMTSGTVLALASLRTERDARGRG